MSVWRPWNTHLAGEKVRRWEGKMVWLLHQSLVVSQIVKNRIFLWSSSLTPLNICPHIWKQVLWKVFVNEYFQLVLFTIGKGSGQLKWLSTDEKSKLWYIYKIGYYCGENELTCYNVNAHKKYAKWKTPGVKSLGLIVFTWTVKSIGTDAAQWPPGTRTEKVLHGLECWLDLDRLGNWTTLWR